MRSYLLPVSIRTLLAIFIAIAVLLAPALSRTGEASAAIPDHEAQMMEAGHCQLLPAKSADHQKGATKSCCVSMTMAVAIAPSASSEQKLTQAMPPVSSLASFHVNVPAELATPPPRIS